MFNNDEDNEEKPTEFVMKKDNEFLLIWAVIEGEEVYHASPHVQMAQAPIQAGIQTFISQAYQAELEDLVDTEPDEGYF